MGGGFSYGLSGHEGADCTIYSYSALRADCRTLRYNESSVCEFAVQTQRVTVERSSTRQTLARRVTCALLAALSTITTTPGCRSYRNVPETIFNDTACIDAIMRDVDAGAPPREAIEFTTAPLTLRSPEDFNNATFRDLGLNESIEIALTNSDVLRDLGATVLRSPQLIPTNEFKGLVETDPQASVEAALSAYDAQFYAFGKWQNNYNQH